MIYSQTVFGGGGVGFDGGGAAGQFGVDGAECDELDVDLYLSNHYENMLHTAIEECGKLVFDFFSIQNCRYSNLFQLFAMTFL